MVDRAVGSEEAPGRVFGSVDVEHEFKDLKFRDSRYFESRNLSKDETSVNVGGAPLETTAKATGARLGLGGEFAMREGVVPRARADYTRSGGDTNEYGGGVELNLRFQARFAKRSPGARADEARALFFSGGDRPFACALRCPSTVASIWLHHPQVLDFDAAPTFVQILRNQPPVAVVRLVFAARQAAFVQHLP